MIGGRFPEYNYNADVSIRLIPNEELREATQNDPPSEKPKEDPKEDPKKK